MAVGDLAGIEINLLLVEAWEIYDAGDMLRQMQA